jgi:hypothetical protein
MITDIRKPNVSKVAKGTMGKNILIYGDGGTGKTSNAVKAPDTLVLGFEPGLAGLEGVRYFLMQNWTDFQQAVKLLTLAAADTKNPLPYKTVVVDGIDRMGILSEKYVSALHGANSISEVGGDARFSIWKDYANENDIQIMALINSPYSMIWIDHAATRKQSTPTGEEFDQIYPAGASQVAAKVFDECDICAYAQRQPNTVDGHEVLSTLFLRSDNSVATKTRFRKVVSFIPEWDYDKLEKAIDDGIALDSSSAVSEEDAAGQKREEIKQEVSEAAPDTQENPVAPNIPIKDIVTDIGLRLKTMAEKGDHQFLAYKKFLADVIKNPKFSCQKATDADRPTLEAIDDFLKKSGFAPSKI